MNANIMLLQSPISRIFPRRFFITSKYFQIIALLNKTLRFIAYDELKRSNKKAVETQKAVSSNLMGVGYGSRR